MMEYNVKVDVFEGPLDLLLHLINKLEIDIYDIPMTEITEQYMLYIHTMQDLQLDVASEYLVMAATLLAIKSKMLLPKHEDDLLDDEQIGEYEEDPRDELVERLLEYRRYKEAANELKEKEQDRSLFFTKPPSDLSEYAEEMKSERLDLNVTIYDMLGAFHKLLRRKRLQKPLNTKIARQEISIESRMEEILDELRRLNRRVHFFQLFPHHNRSHIIVTFLAILELMKRNDIVVEQEKNFDNIWLILNKGVEAVGVH